MKMSLLLIAKINHFFVLIDQKIESYLFYYLSLFLAFKHCLYIFYLKTILKKF